MTFKNRFSYKITGKKALQLKITFDEDNLSIDWGKKVGIAQSYINPAILNIYNIKYFTKCLII